jgi:hypothetical protein
LSNTLRAGSLYLIFVLAGNLIWEILQLPLFTIWQEGTPWQQAFAVAHCTLGDVLIAAAALALALFMVRHRWPAEHFTLVAMIAIVIGLCYTAFSEWLNVYVRGTWTYSRFMPVVSLGDANIGVVPLLQWWIIPSVSFFLVRRYAKANS